MNIHDTIIQFNHPTAIAIGSFDGIHLGHRSVIENCVSKAKEKGLESLVLSFQNHPKTITQPTQVPQLLTQAHEKQRILSDLGVDHALIVPFDTLFSQQSPDTFIEDILIHQLKAKYISVGYNFRFGHQAQGTPERLNHYESQFKVHVQDPFKVNGQIVSSTLIRKTLIEGDFKQALEWLGGSFLIHGEVVRGQGIATSVLGIPTANLSLEKTKLIPKKGVYLCDIILPNQSRHQGIVNIGNRPTFKGIELSTEAYIFDFEGDLYGQEITLYLKRFIRPEQRFSGPEALKEQIQKDIQQAKSQLK